MIALGIDPGADTGWALAQSLGGAVTLLACGLGSTWYLDWNALPRPDKGVVEGQRIRPGGRADPKDIILLANRAGKEMAMVEWRLRVPVETVFPEQWKGQLPKPATVGAPYIVTNRIKNRCTHTERVAALGLPPALEHNVWDAVGLALYGVGVSIK